MVPQVKPVVRAQRMDQQRQLKKVLAAMVGCDIELGAVLPDRLFRTCDCLAFRTLDILSLIHISRTASGFI